MTKNQKNMFSCFACGWAAGIGFCELVTGHIIIALIDFIFAGINVPFIVKNKKNLKS